MLGLARGALSLIWKNKVKSTLAAGTAIAFREEIGDKVSSTFKGAVEDPKGTALRTKESIENAADTTVEFVDGARDKIESTIDTGKAVLDTGEKIKNGDVGGLIGDFSESSKDLDWKGVATKAFPILGAIFAFFSADSWGGKFGGAALTFGIMSFALPMVMNALGGDKNPDQIAEQNIKDSSEYTAQVDTQRPQTTDEIIAQYNSAPTNG